MNTDQDKYLILHMPRCDAGLDHILAVVKGAIKEAIHLKRVLVMDTCAMSGNHNLGHELRNLDIERYINLDKTQIYKIENNGSIEQIHNFLRYMRIEDFAHDKYPEESVLQLSDTTPVSEAQNNQYEVIVRATIDYAYYKKFYSDILTVAFHPSDKVMHLTDTILKSMGTSLADAQKRSAVYRDIDFSANRDTWQETILDNPLYYICLHVRGNDAHTHIGFIQAASTPNIKAVVKRNIPKGMRIYLMTDITKPGYFSFLEKDYIVYRYYDFPDLKDLVSGGNNRVDNFMLYSVEKNILQYAYIKLVRKSVVPKIIYTDLRYKTPWRYHFLSFIYRTLPNTLKRYQQRIKGKFRYYFG